MDFLVVSPPICPPSEPPSGAFTLAAGLCGHGYEAGLLDLSAQFFASTLEQEPSAPKSPESSRKTKDKEATKPQTDSPVSTAIRYLKESTDGFDPMSHRSALGVLHNYLKGLSQVHPGWRFTLMDITPPCRIHDIRGLEAHLSKNPHPFQELFEGPLMNTIDRHRPRRVLISLAYLSQLPATIAMVMFLKKHAIESIIGGSLPNSLKLTGQGLDLLTQVLPNIETGDGMSLVSAGKIMRPIGESPYKNDKINTNSDKGRLVDRLTWPRLVNREDYLSPKPIIPLPLSIGCWWRRCLFCPDGQMGFHAIPIRTLEEFVDSIPETWKSSGPVFHLIDSALPPKSLDAFLPLARKLNAGFYGFARPTFELLENDLIARAGQSGCLMLQLGVESGSHDLLDLYRKGINPEVSSRVLRSAAEAGIRTYVYLLMGLPGERDSHRHATLDMMVNHREDVDFLNLSLFNLPRSGSLVKDQKKHDIEIEEFTGRDRGLRLYYPFTVNGKSPRKEAREFIKSVFLKNHIIHAANLRTPRWLRAAHLALMKLPHRHSPWSSKD